MYQAPATIWNAVAETGPLATEWAEGMFGLPQDVMTDEINAELERVQAETGSGVLAAAYLVLHPMPFAQQAAKGPFAVRRVAGRHPWVPASSEPLLHL